MTALFTNVAVTDEKITTTRRSTKENPFLALVGEAAKDGKTRSFELNLTGNNPAEREKFLNSHVTLLRKAGDTLTTPVTVRVKVEKTDFTKGTATVKFQTQEKIRRQRKTDDKTTAKTDDKPVAKTDEKSSAPAAKPAPVPAKK